MWTKIEDLSVGIKGKCTSICSVGLERLKSCLCVEDNRSFKVRQTHVPSFNILSIA